MSIDPGIDSVFCDVCRGRAIFMLRNIRRLTGTEFGEKLKISHAAIFDIERGKTKISASMIIKIAKILDVKPRELF